ncbi:MAG: tetratricopeptide repeat protein [Aggregatilineales bacterium]
MRQTKHSVLRRRASLSVAFGIIAMLAAAAGNASYNAQRADALIALSRDHAAHHRHDEAIAAIDEALQLQPNDPMLYLERGQRIMLIYEWDRALADYNRAIALAPELPEAYYYRALLYASVPEGLDARRAAIADFERYLTLAPEGEFAQAAAHSHVELAALLEALSDRP